MSWLSDERHVVAIWSTGVAGEWRTYCPGCSVDADAPVVRCTVYPEQWPEMSTLFEAVLYP